MNLNQTQPKLGMNSSVLKLTNVIRMTSIIFLGTMLAVLPARVLAQYTDGNLTVFKVTSSSALANTGTSIVVEEYNPTTASQSSAVTIVALPSSTSSLGVNDIVVSGTGTSAGEITRSENGRYIIIPGYKALVGSANSTFNTNGAIRSVNGSGTIGAGVNASVLWLSGNNNLRGATSDDLTNYWITGNGVGIQTTQTGGASITTVSSTSTNNRASFIYNGQLYLTTGAGSQGIYSVGTGKPITTGQTSTRLFAPANTDTYGFSISPDGKTIYFVGATTGGGTAGVYRSTFNGSVWTTGTQISTLTNLTGITVDWNNYTFSASSANGAVIYFCNPTTVNAANDNGISALSVTVLRTEPVTANNAFRGICFAPIKQTVSKGANTIAASSLTAATADIALFQFNIAADEGKSTIKKVVVHQNGTLTLGSDITSLRLYDDVNNNGTYESGTDILLSTGSVSGADVTFSNISQTAINEGSSKNYIVVGNTASSPASGTFIPTIVSNKTLNTVNYTTNLYNAGGSWVSIGAIAPTGNTLTYTASVTPTSTITVGAGTEPLTISSLTNTQVAASLNFDFTITDDGVTPSTDALSTLISQIVLNAGVGNTVADWSTVIAGVELSDGTNSTTSSTIAASSITFSGVSNSVGALGYIADNASKTYTLKIWLNSNLSPALKLTIDGERFVFRIQNSDVTTDIAGSQFASGQDVNSGSGNNLIDVVVSALTFIQQPSNANTGFAMTPDVTVAAQDANGNRDLGFNSQIRITSTGTLSGTPVDATASSGIASFTALTHTVAGTGLTLTAQRTATLDLNVASNAFNITTQLFGAGNIAVLVAASNTANNTTASVVELNTSTANQTPVYTYNINGTNGSNALRFSGSATSTGYLANSDDRSLLFFTGANTISSSGNINTFTGRGVGSLGISYNYNLETTYTGISGNQTRCATTVNNTNFYIGDQGGLYTNGSSTPSPSANIRGVKSFGGIVYAQSTATPPIGTINAPSGGTLTGLAGLTASGTNLQDFYLVSSSSNTVYDVLYLLYTTSIAKYSLVSGSWVSNGSYSSLGGFGIAAEKQSTGANLYVTTGTGATAANSVTKLFDAAGFNSTINITTANNVTLYTATSPTTIKGVAFAPSALGTPTHLAVTSVNGGLSPSATEPFSVTVQAQDASNAPAVVAANTVVTLSIATGSGSLGGILTGTINAGSTSVTLTGITYTIAQTNVSLNATRTSGDILSVGTSSLFDVLGAATQLVYSAFPSTGYTNNAVAAFTVVAKRADNSIDLNYPNNITLSLNSGTGSVTGTLTKQTVSGVATFNDIAFTNSGIKTLLAASGALSATSSSINISTVSLTEDILPQYIQGLNGTNNSRIPFAYRVTISGLNANATYRYINQADTIISTTSNGAGNIIFRDPLFFYRSTSASLASAGSYGEFTTDASGNYSGWFITEPTGNARFTPGTNIYMRIILNDGAGGTTAAIRLNTSNTVQVVNFGTGVNDGTGLRGNSSASARNFVFMYDNTAGTGRPIAGTYVELDGSDNIAIPYIQFYSDDVNDIDGAYGVIIPNNLPDGIRRIEQRDLTTGNIAGCVAVDNDGIWPSGANTINPNAGTTPILITSSDALLDPLSTYSTDPTSITASVNPVCEGNNSVLSVVGGSLGTGANWFWYSGSCGSTPEGSGNSITVSPTSVTNYFVRAEGTCNTTNCTNLTVNTNTLSMEPTSISGISAICAGGSTTLIQVGGSLGTGANYFWYSGSCGGTLEGSGTSITVSPSVTTTYFVRAEGTCNNTVCASVTVAVNTPSTAPASVTSNDANNEICSGSSVDLTVNGGILGTGANWVWYEGGCGSGSSVGSGSTITLTPTPGSHTYYVRAEGACNNTSCVQIIIYVSLSMTASVVVPPINNLPAYACNGTSVLNINVPAVLNAFEYIWDGPPGTTFNGGANPYTSTTSSANILFGSPGTGASGYYIGVQATNACGSTLRKVQWVRNSVSVPAAIIPANNRITECANTSANYSIAAVGGATSYLWTITGNATVIGTGTSVVVNFGSTWTGGILSVAAQTPCYTSPAKTLVLSNTAPAIGAMSGVFTACVGSTQTYSVPSTSGISFYTWTLPANCSGSSTGNSINVTFNSGFNGGNISVTATSICGLVTVPRSKSITVGTPGTPSSITGSANGICSSVISYTCPPQAGATFIWSSTVGTVQSGQGSNSVSISFGSFTTGTISVVASNGCGSSAARTISVKGAPNTPGVITANPVIWCNNDAGIQFTSSLSGLSGTYTLNWTVLPASAATYVSGQGTNTYTVDWNAGNAIVSLTASNACGNGTRTFAASTSCREAGYTTEQTISTIEVYPNPASDKLNIKYVGEQGGDMSLQLMDVTGKLVLNQTIKVSEVTGTHTIDITGFAKGVYMLHVSSINKTENIRVVMQ